MKTILCFSLNPAHRDCVVGYAHLVVAILTALLAGTMGQRPGGGSYPARVRYTQGLIAVCLLFTGWCWIERPQLVPFGSLVEVVAIGVQTVFIGRMTFVKPSSEAGWLRMILRVAPFALVVIVLSAILFGMSLNSSHPFRQSIHAIIYPDDGKPSEKTALP